MAKRTPGIILNQYFDKIIYLNCDAREDRNKKMLTELEKYGILADRFGAVPAETNIESFNLSQIKMLETFLNSDLKSMLIFEDDVNFSGDIFHIEKSLSEVPDEWDQIYLGANIFNFDFIRLSKNLVKLTAAWTTHAVGYSRKGAEKILRLYRSTDPKSGVFDNILAQYFHRENSCYLVDPICCTQRLDYSDLEKRKTDYAESWKKTRSRLKLSRIDFK